MIRGRDNRRKSPPRRIELPRVAINWRLVLAPPAAVIVMLGIVALGRAVLNRPVTKLTIEGEFQRVTAPQIEAALAGELGKGFLSLNLDALGERLRDLDWVDEVSIGRRWPDRLVVHVTEHTAAARWGEDGLLDIHGELFAKDGKHLFPELPRLDGPDGSELELAAQYLALRGPLAAAGLSLDTLSMDERGALSIKLGTGQEIRIGRQDKRARIDRFFSVVAPALSSEFEHIRFVDMRYTNGFSVSWLNRPETGFAENRELQTRG